MCKLRQSQRKDNRLMSNNFARINYTKLDGKPSSAYHNPVGNLAYDVYTRMPVNLTRRSGEWAEFDPAEERAIHEAKEKIETKKTKISQQRQQKRPQQVVLKAQYTLWQIIPVGLFALAMIWLCWEFL